VKFFATWYCLLKFWVLDFFEDVFHVFLLPLLLLANLTLSPWRKVESDMWRHICANGHSWSDCTGVCSEMWLYGQDYSCPCSLISCVILVQIWRQQPPCHSLYTTYYFMIASIIRRGRFVHTILCILFLMTDKMWSCILVLSPDFWTTFTKLQLKLVATRCTLWTSHPHPPSPA